MDISELLYIASNTNWKEKRKTKITFTKEEIDILFHNLKNKSLRNVCIFLVCLECGVRISEALSTKLSKFQKNTKGIWTLRIEAPKNKMSRYVAVPDYAAQYINKYIATERRRITSNIKKYEYLFVSEKGPTKGKKLGSAAFQYQLKNAAKEGGLDAVRISSHLSRATRATKLKADGLTDEEIKKAIGNKVTINPYIDYDNPDYVVLHGKSFYSIDIE